MGNQIGEQLAELKNGDSVVVIINGERYEGTVTNTERWMCELVAGFMESGGISVRLKIGPEPAKDNDAATDHLLITATEEVPQDWEVPQASFYDPTEDETTTRLGTVDEVRVADEA